MAETTKLFWCYIRAHLAISSQPPEEQMQAGKANEEEHSFQMCGPQGTERQCSHEQGKTAIESL